MRVLILTQYHPGIGGIETHTSYVLKTLLDHKHQVRLAIPSKNNPLTESGLERQANVVYIPYSALGELVARVSDQVSDFRADLLHVNCNLFFGIVGLLVHWMTGVRLVITLHLDLLNPDVGEKLVLDDAASYVSRLFSETSRIGVVSRSSIQDLKVFGVPVSKIVYIGNVVDPALFDSNKPGADIRGRFKLLAETKVIGYFGRFAEEKGLRYLLEAIQELRKVKRIDIKAMFVGEGPDQENLLDLIARYGLDRTVTILGPVPYSSLPDYYSATDVVILPSLTEAFGISLIEALAMKRPIVASDLEPIREIIRHKVSGILVPPGDSLAIAKGILEVLDHPAEAYVIAQQGHANVIRRFNWKVLYRRLERLYGFS